MISWSQRCKIHRQNSQVEDDDIDVLEEGELVRVGGTATRVHLHRRYEMQIREH